ncbi:MAG: hypothetical protein JW996_06795 [Candidatus Cloacimonetes bacterium]|nr:hypothetical protein [Candidatus Cloacimonadota bacterium]
MYVKLSILLLLLLSSIYLSSQPERSDTHIPTEMNYDFELIKFYLNRQEFVLAKTKIDQMFQEGLKSDSLYYFKGVSLMGLSEWDQAADNFSYIMQKSYNEKLQQASWQNFQTCISYLNVFNSIEKLTDLVDNIQNSRQELDILLHLADIYEANQLYGEANDVYNIILNEKYDLDEIEIKLQIVTNELYLNNYQQAIELLNPIIALNDSLYNEKALFLKYLAHNSLDQYSEAKTALLRLYLSYPQHTNRTEIIESLAELYLRERQYLLSWYFLNDLAENSTEAQKFHIYREINKIKRLFLEDSLIVDQFKYFRPDFDEEITGKLIKKSN